MTTDEARATLERMVAHDTDPKLDADDIDALMAVAGPGQLLNAAAAEGWRWKAGRCVPDYNFAIDNQRSDEGQVYEHCLAQAADYAQRAMTETGGLGPGGGGIVTVGIVTDTKAASDELPDDLPNALGEDIL